MDAVDTWRTSSVFVSHETSSSIDDGRAAADRRELSINSDTFPQVNTGTAIELYSLRNVIDPRRYREDPVGDQSFYIHH